MVIVCTGRKIAVCYGEINARREKRRQYAIMRGRDDRNETTRKHERRTIMPSSITRENRSGNMPNSRCAEEVISKWNIRTRYGTKNSCKICAHTRTRVQIRDFRKFQCSLIPKVLLDYICAHTRACFNVNENLKLQIVWSLKVFADPWIIGRLVIRSKITRRFSIHDR